ncbi:MAG: PBP1A family penicillin-binding protein [Eubacteriales bacterium]|nr:PBP1A family penicillin-binding protein [Eubacteriales bacterium]
MAKGYRKKSRAKKIGFAVLTLFLIGLTTMAMCLGAFVIYLNVVIMPEANLDITSLSMKFNSVIYYDENGTEQVLQKLASEENREWVEMDSIPEYLQNAFVAIEDQRFYEHKGVDWKRTMGATLNWILPSGDSYGGSTITQQLVKNMTDDDDYSVKRKVMEIMRALTLEKKVGSKKTILELYMNIIYFGKNAYGVQTAAKTYFNKPVNELDLAECALIAGLTQNPAAYNPFKYPEDAKERQEVVLSAMYAQGYISQSEYNDAVNETLEYEENTSDQKENKAYSYFTDMVITDVVNDLQDQLGYSETYARTLVTSGGLSIYSTVDMHVQNIMEEVFEDDDNFPNISEDGIDPQAAMIVVDPTNGHIRGVVGGRGEKTESLVLNRATQSTRSPGSSIKPLSTYAPAIDQGLITPYSVVTDMPVFEIDDSPWPRNENRTYDGQTTIMDGVAQSTNTVAVQVLKMLTPQSAYNFLTDKLGFTTLSENRDVDYGPMALGGLTNGATVREMAQGYTALANYGYCSEAVSYTKVVDANGETILSNEDNEPTQVFEHPESTPYYINDMLTNAVEDGTGKLAAINGIDVAGKTGTTTDNKDRWFAGYTPYYVGVCWFGYDQKYGLPSLSPNPAVALWSDVMDELHEDKQDKSFDEPEEGTFEEAQYCLDSGLAPSSACRGDPRGGRVATGWFYVDDIPDEEDECNLHKWRYRSVALLDLTRLFPSRVEVTDEYYCYEGKNDPIGEGIRVRSSRGHYSVPKRRTYSNSTPSQNTTTDDTSDETPETPATPTIPEVPAVPETPTVPETPDTTDSTAA